MDLVDGTDKEKWHQPKHLRSEIWKYFKLKNARKPSVISAHPFSST